MQPIHTVSSIWAGFLDLLRIVIWPALIFVVAMYFKEAFTYLIISVREFNIFGAKGELKNAYLVIEEKAEEKYQAKLKDETAKKETQEIEKLKQQAEELKKNAEKKEQDIADYKKMAVRGSELADNAIFLAVAIKKEKERLEKEKEKLESENKKFRAEMKHINDALDEAGV